MGELAGTINSDTHVSESTEGSFDSIEKNETLPPSPLKEVRELCFCSEFHSAITLNYTSGRSMRDGKFLSGHRFGITPPLHGMVYISCFPCAFTRIVRRWKSTSRETVWEGWMERSYPENNVKADRTHTGGKMRQHAGECVRWSMCD